MSISAISVSEESQTVEEIGNQYLTVEPLSEPETITMDREIERGRAILEALAYKAQSVWAQTYAQTMDCFVRVVHVARDVVGAVVRDTCFFPLKCSLIANRQFVRDQIAIEEAYYRDFWDPLKPTDPNLKDHAKIREKFDLPVDRVVPIQLKDGRTVEITCRIIETKEKGDHFYNFIQVPGIYTTISNNIVTTHPYLAAYLNAHKEEASLPPARFIIISENNLNGKPTSLDEAGYILLQTLKAMRAEFGEIDQLVAHSLGTIFTASALKQAEDPKLLPKNICFDRGPSSIWEASKKYFFGIGCAMYLLVRFGRWHSDVEQNIIDFCEKWKERPSVVVTGVVEDHHFHGSANLCLGEKIQKIKDIAVLVFSIPRQVVSELALHNLKPDLFHPLYLVKESHFMKSWENLTEAIVRHSLPIFKMQEQIA